MPVTTAAGTRRPGGVGFDPLRDSRHREARAARELQDWLADLELRNYAARTIDSYERTCAALLRDWPNVAFNEYTDSHVLHTLKRFPAKSRHQNKSAFEGWFKWGRLTRRIEANPMELVPSIRYKPQRRYDTFTEAEYEALCGLPCPDGPLMTLLLWTGIRRQEARNMAVKRLAFDRRQVVVIEGAKGSKERTVPMLPAVAAAMDELITQEGLNRDDYLWYDRPGGHENAPPRHSKAIGNTSFQRWWERCLDDAGVRYRKPHMTRHSFATTVRRRGVPAEDLQRWLGHSHVSTTLDIYVHADEQDAADRLFEVFA